MPKVSLEVNEKDVFGEFMPSVNIDRVEISYAAPEEDDSWGYGDKTKVAMEFSVYITYPPHLSDDAATAKEFVDDNLGDIRVFYAWNPYTGFNKNLRQNRLMLQDVFVGGYRELLRGDSYASLDFIARYEASRVAPVDRADPASTEYKGFVASTETMPLDSAPSYADRAYLFRPLIYSTSIGGMVDSGWSPTFIYDEKGNRTLKLGSMTKSIRISNWYFDQYSDYCVWAFCGSVPIAGHDIDATTAALTKESPALFQRRFGDISYEEALSYNSVPQTTKEGFVYAATDAVYAGNPIQALNGTYRDSTEASHEELRNKVADLLSTFEGLLERSPSLEENYNSVATIMQTNENSPDILRQLNRYRKTFTSKDPTTLSGRFYLAYQSFISSFNSLLLNQEELKRVLYLNTRVIDTRREDYGVSYIPPIPADASWYELTGDDYIPSKWVTYSRVTRDVRPTQGALSDFAEWILEEGFGSIFYANPSPISSKVPFSNPLNYDGFDSAGADEDYASALGLDIAQAKRKYHEEWDERGVWSNGSVGRAVMDRRSEDIVVRNEGIIHFDWEKALWTRSQLAYVLSLARLKRYLGLEVPYSYFPVIKTTLERKEQLLVTQLIDSIPEFTQSFDDAIIGDMDRAFTHITEATEHESLMDRGYNGSNNVTIKIENYMKENLSSDAGIMSNTPYAAPLTDFVRHTVRPPSTFDRADDTDATHYPQPQLWKKYGYPWVGLTSLTPNLTSEGAMDSHDVRFDLSRYIVDAMTMNYSSLGGGSAIMRYAAAFDADSTGDFSFAEILTGMNDVMAMSAADDFKLLYGNEAFEELDLEVFSGIPSVTQLEEDVDFSYVKFKNFDVMNIDPDGTLVGFSKPDHKFQDGYRLMSFEFRDYMDDDVAYRNTIGWEHAEADWRTGDPSKYKFSVSVQDRSLLFYDQVYRYVKKAYDEFMVYYDFCFDKCSYDSKDFVFEDWFKDAVLQHWPSESEQPWLRAPFIFNALRMVLFGTNAFGETRDEAEEQMNISTLGWISKISPYSGRLEYLQQFRFWFANTLNILYPQADLPQTVEALVSGEFEDAIEIIAAVDLTRPEDERRLVYDDAGALTMSSRASGFNAAYERLLNISLLYDAADPGSVGGADVEYDIAGTGEFSYLGSTKSDGGSDDHGALYFGAINFHKNILFQNSWEIDKQIFGDVKLSALRADDYEPFPTSITSGVSDVIGSLLPGYEDFPSGMKIMIANPLSGEMYDRTEIKWEVQRYRVLYNASDWTRDDDHMLGGPYSRFGYFATPGIELGRMQGTGHEHAIVIPYTFFASGAPGEDYVSEAGTSWSQKWQKMVERAHGEGYSGNELDNITKTYSEARLNLVFEVWNSAANRWVGIKQYKLPVPVQGAVGANNWFAAKRIKFEVEGRGGVASEYERNLIRRPSDGGVSMGYKEATYADLQDNALTARMAGIAFNQVARGASYETVDTDELGQLFKWGGEAHYTALLAASYYMDLAEGKTGDWAFEAWAKGGNIMLLNHQWFGEAPLLNDKFHGHSTNMGTSTRFWQWNELRYYRDAAPSPTDWQIAFDYEDRDFTFVMYDIVV